MNRRRIVPVTYPFLPEVLLDHISENMYIPIGNLRHDIKGASLNGPREKTLRAFFKLIVWRWGRERRSRGLGIAGVHATVLTILVAITSAYYIFTRDKVHHHILITYYTGKYIARFHLINVPRSRTIQNCPS